MLQIDILRHGQTDSNIQGCYLGSTDAPLNETGMKQAQAAAQRLKGIQYDAIYASPLIRAWTTASLVAQPHKLEVQRLDGIAERNFGIFDNLTYQQMQSRYPAELRQWEENWIDYVIPGGESAAMVDRRIADALAKVTEAHSDGRILLVSHLGAIRHMISHLLELSIEESWHFTLDNTGVASIRMENGYGVLAGLG